MFSVAALLLYVVASMREREREREKTVISNQQTETMAGNIKGASITMTRSISEKHQRDFTL